MKASLGVARLTGVDRGALRYAMALQARRATITDVAYMVAMGRPGDFNQLVLAFFEGHRTA